MAERVASEAQDGGGEFPRNGAARARAQRRAPPGGADRGHLLERGRWPKGTRATSWFWPRDRIFFTTASSSFQQFPFAILKKQFPFALFARLPLYQPTRRMIFIKYCNHVVIKIATKIKLSVKIASKIKMTTQ
jgi:hypothetical protein